MSTSTTTMEMPTATQFDEAEIICECYTCGVGMTCADVDDIPPEAFHEDCPECEACRTKAEATANCRCDACGDCTDISNKCLHEKPCHCDYEEEETEEEVFDRKYPKASCRRCTTPVTGATVVLCGGAGGACETWYCGDCHEDGTADCGVCK